MEQKTVKTAPRDFFLHLLAIVSLYASATSFLILAFQFLNVLYPDLLQAGNYYYLDSAFERMRWAIAMLIVLFPVYIFTMRFLKKDVEKNQEKRESRIRRWLTYFTLFIAALVVITNFVTLVFWFLDGEVTTRFLLKVLAVFFVAGSIFGYYFTELRRELKGLVRPAGFQIFIWGVIVIVTALVVLGAMRVGSPEASRMRKADARRVEDLQSIQSNLFNYWMSKKALPENLSAIEDDIMGFKIPADPETGNAYAYEKKTDSSFVLCADFSTVRKGAVENVPRAGYLDESWDHDSGRVCFDRIINEDLYEKSQNIIPTKAVR